MSEQGYLTSDRFMPRLGGRAVLDHIRASGAKRPVLFASGYSSGDVHSNFILKDGLELLTKPYSRNELLVKVRALLDSRL